jgi:hypothetical protein
VRGCAQEGASKGLFYLMSFLYKQGFVHVGKSMARGKGSLEGARSRLGTVPPPVARAHKRCAEEVTCGLGMYLTDPVTENEELFMVPTSAMLHTNNRLLLNRTKLALQLLGCVPDRASGHAYLCILLTRLSAKGTTFGCPATPRPSSNLPRYPVCVRLSLLWMSQRSTPHYADGTGGSDRGTGPQLSLGAP